MNWYKKATSMIDLPKLYKLFKGVGEYHEDPELLMEVFEEWQRFLNLGLRDVNDKLQELQWAKEEHEANPTPESKKDLEDTESDYHDLDIIKERIEKAIEVMDNNIDAEFPKKLAALNFAVITYHRDVSLLEHYLKRLYDEEIKDFLNWMNAPKANL